MADLSYEELRYAFKETKEKLDSREARLRELGVTDWEPKPVEEEKVIIELCHHIKEDGWRCGSPAMTDRRYCRYHLCIRGRRLKMARSRARRERWLVELPPLENLYAVQVGLQHVLDALASGQLDRRLGGTMIYGLQLATSNLRLPKEIWDGSDCFDNVAKTTWGGFEKAHGLPQDFDVDTPPDEAFPPPVTSPAATELADQDGVNDDLGLEDLLERDPEACKRRASELVRRYRRKLRYDEDKLERALQLLAAAHSAAESQKKDPATATAEEVGQPDSAAVAGVPMPGSGARKDPQGEPDTKDERAEGAS